MEFNFSELPYFCIHMPLYCSLLCLMQTDDKSLFPTDRPLAYYTTCLQNYWYFLLNSVIVGRLIFVLFTCFPCISVVLYVYWIPGSSLLLRQSDHYFWTEYYQISNKILVSTSSQFSWNWRRRHLRLPGPSILHTYQTTISLVTLSIQISRPEPFPAKNHQVPWSNDSLKAFYVLRKCKSAAHCFQVLITNCFQVLITVTRGCFPVLKH